MAEEVRCTDPGFFRRFPGSDLFPHAIRLLAAGRPVEIDQIAVAADVSPDEVRAVLDGQLSTEWDERRRLVGFGLTLRPTAHRLTLSGRQLYAWCAMDTLIFPLILGERAVAASDCPATGQAIRVELKPQAVLSVDPEQAVISEVGAREVTDLRGEICDHGHFFASLGAARSWTTEHPDGRIATVWDAFDQVRRSLDVHRRRAEVRG
jgi:alkylmercury lyase